MRALLIVEDDTDVSEGLKISLEKRGFDVQIAVDGREALAMIDPAAPPAAILLDLAMPHMDGWQLRRALRADPRLARIPVLLISGLPDLARHAKTLGAVGYLSKPVDRTRLMSLLSAYCPPPS